MQYAKIENNKVVQIGLPRTGILKDGSTVSGYHLLPEKVLKSEGWLPLEENKPEYNELTQYLEFDEYVITDEKVIANYEVRDKEIEIVDESVSDELVAMAEAIVDFDNRLRALEGGSE